LALRWGQQTSEFRPGTFYYYWVSIDTPAYTLPIGAAAVLLALAGVAPEVADASPSRSFSTSSIPSIGGSTPVSTVW